MRTSHICTVKTSEASREGPSELMVALTVAFHSELPIGSEIVTASLWHSPCWLFGRGNSECRHH